MLKLLMIFVSIGFAQNALADATLAAALATVSVSSGWSGPMITIVTDDDSSTGYVPMTEQAAAQAMEMQGKGKFACKVKISGFAAGTGEGKGQHQVFAIENCAR